MLVVMSNICYDDDIDDDDAAADDVVDDDDDEGDAEGDVDSDIEGKEDDSDDVFTLEPVLRHARQASFRAARPPSFLSSAPSVPQPCIASAEISDSPKGPAERPLAGKANSWQKILQASLDNMQPDVLPFCLLTSRLAFVVGRRYRKGPGPKCCQKQLSSLDCS